MLLANEYSETIDVVRLPPSNEANVAIAKATKDGINPNFTLLLRLRLPDRVVPADLDSSISRFRLTSLPGPRPSCSGKNQDHTDAHHLPFSSSPEDAIVHVNLVLSNHSWKTNALICDFVVHRSAIMSLLEKYSEIVQSATPGPLFPDSEHRRRKNIGRTPNTLAWKDWGPDVTHWIGQGPKGSNTTKSVHGQKLVWVDFPAHQLVVCDFNPCTVRRARRALATRNEGKGVRVTKETRELDGPTPDVKKLVETRYVRDFVTTSTEDNQGDDEVPEEILEVTVNTNGERDCSDGDVQDSRQLHTSDAFDDGSEIDDATESDSEYGLYEELLELDSGLTDFFATNAYGDTEEMLKRQAEVSDNIERKLKRQAEAKIEAEAKRKEAYRPENVSKVHRKLVECSVLRADEHLTPVRCNLPFLETRRVIKIDAPSASVNLLVDEGFLLVEKEEDVGVS